MSEKTWTCQIGGVPPEDVPPGADSPMRHAVVAAYKEVTGRESDYIFSGWGDPLPERRRAVVEDRMPDEDVLVAEEIQRLRDQGLLDRVIAVEQALPERRSVLGIIRGLMIAEHLGDVHDEINLLCELVGIPRPEGDFADGWTENDWRSVGVEDGGH